MTTGPTEGKMPAITTTDVEEGGDRDQLTRDHEADSGHVHGPNCSHHHHHQQVQPFIRSTPKLGRNDPCSCGSGQKYKKCCGKAS